MNSSRATWDAQSLPYDRVVQLWQKNLSARPFSSTSSRDAKFEFNVLNALPESLHAEMAKLSKSQQLQQLVNHMMIQTKDAKLQIGAADKILSRVMLCLYDGKRDGTATRAHEMLLRLPRYPPTLLLDRDWFKGAITGGRLPSASFFGNLMRAWSDGQSPEAGTYFQSLEAASCMDQCTIQLSLAIANADICDVESAMNFHMEVKRFLNRLVTLMDHVYDPGVMLHGFHSTTWDDTLTVLITFLWAVWQRGVTLYLASVLRFDLDDGPAPGTFFGLEYPQLFRRSFSQYFASASAPPAYACPWAIQLLRTSIVSLALDFRHLFHSFDSAHHGARPRCTAALGQCGGTAPEKCGRFTDRSLVLAEQSVHTSSCRGCRRLKWNEHSYRSVRGGRAVDISKAANSIHYCKADGDTMAVSHVWSHGQGGRPSTGINECLHNRYVRLARTYACRSYWIDTTCIPEPEDLRKEAIASINGVFTTSKMTLICDRDLMSMAAPSELGGIASRENLLATLLLCDWNVRAWTAFESIRGRHNLHILCAHDQIVQVKDLVRKVLEHGALDLSAVALASRHLLPLHIPNVYSIHDASALLSHRHATRSGDDILIWSLMCGRRPDEFTKDPVRFWTTRTWQNLNTGYLMSSAPRVGNAEGATGLRWAPTSPNVRSLHVTQSNGPLNTYSSTGEGTRSGLITREGLQADWLTYVVRPDGRDNGTFWRTTRTERNIRTTSTGEVISKRTEIVNPCWARVNELQQRHQRVCLLMPMPLVDGIGIYGDEYFGPEESKRANQLVLLAYSDETQPLSKEITCSEPRSIHIAGPVDDCWIFDSVGEWNRDFPKPGMSPQFVLLS